MCIHETKFTSTSKSLHEKYNSFSTCMWKLCDIWLISHAPNSSLNDSIILARIIFVNKYEITSSCRSEHLFLRLNNYLLAILNVCLYWMFIIMLIFIFNFYVDKCMFCFKLLLTYFCPSMYAVAPWNSTTFTAVSSRFAKMSRSVAFFSLRIPETFKCYCSLARDCLKCKEDFVVEWN